MHICYVDEAGCPGALPSPTSDIQPVLVIAGLFVPQVNLSHLTHGFLRLKHQFYPGLRRPGTPWLEIAKQEIKGSDLRRDIRNASRNRRRAVFGFLDDVLELLDDTRCRVVARIYIKGPGQPFRGKEVYASSVQALCGSFQNYLAAAGSQGVMIADSRTPALNSVVSHSIFTQKFRVAGDPYDRIIEMPTFGHSENHVPLQISDLLCSALITPMATSAYCAGQIRSVHVHPRDALVRTRYAARMRGFAHRYFDSHRMRGGFTVHDAIAQRSANLLLAAPVDVPILLAAPGVSMVAVDPIPAAAVQ